MFTGGMCINTMEIYNSVIICYLLVTDRYLIQDQSRALHWSCLFTVAISSSDNQLAVARPSS